ncbi:hypothetical protein PCE1_004114 [Barthelona sp. PCE]
MTFTNSFSSFSVIHFNPCAHFPGLIGFAIYDYGRNSVSRSQFDSVPHILNLSNFLFEARQMLLLGNTFYVTSTDCYCYSYFHFRVVNTSDNLRIEQTTVENRVLVEENTRFTSDIPVALSNQLSNGYNKKSVVEIFLWHLGSINFEQVYSHALTLLEASFND